VLLLENVYIFYAIPRYSVCRFRLYSRLVRQIDSVSLGKVQICLFSIRMLSVLSMFTASTNDRTPWSSVPAGSQKCLRPCFEEEASCAITWVLNWPLSQVLTCTTCPLFSTPVKDTPGFPTSSIKHLRRNHAECISTLVRPVTRPIRLWIKTSDQSIV
jgi:hypothetical protein